MAVNNAIVQYNGGFLQSGPSQRGGGCQNV